MSEPQPDPGVPDPSREEQVGGLGEEAVKLLYALQGLAGGPGDEPFDEPGDRPRDEPGGQPGGPAGAAGATAASALRAAAESAQRIGEHLGSGSEACRYCPVCQGIALARATPPEVRHHLAAAGTSLLRAVASLMATPVPDAADRDPAAPAGPAEDPAADPAPDLADEWEDD